MWLGLLFYTVLFFIFYLYFILFFFSFNVYKNNLRLFFINNSNFFLFLIFIFFYFGFNFLYSLELISLSYNVFFNYINIYYFPFFFIFLFVTFLSILFCIAYNKSEFYLFIFYCLSILFIGFNLFLSNELIFFFFLYETLLIPSFFILYKFAKTRRAVEAAYLMFFWTQFGAIFLIFGFFYLFLITESTKFDQISLFSFNLFDVNLLILLFIIGFGVKFPIWPFYGWLPKAHVEASTNFSIFLSGVLVKFAFFAFLKFYFLLTFEVNLFFLCPLLLVGILDSSFKISYQIDLKKIVAFSTVIEMHWLALSLLTGFTPIFLAGFCMLVSHAFLSSIFFFLVDYINRRFKTRLITEINSLALFAPKLFLILLVNLLIFLGFPGSLFFIAEFIFFSFLIDFSPEMSVILIIVLYLLVPTFFFKSWWAVTSGDSSNLSKSNKIDLDSKEFFLVFSLTFILFWLGFSWQFFLF